MTQGENFRAHMKAVNRTSGSNEPHLSEAQMIAYYRGEMSAAEHETAESHLVRCEQCVALFRSSRDFLEPASAGETKVTAAETDEAWQSLLPLLQNEPQTKASSSESTVVTGDFQRGRVKPLSRVTLALAASLLLSLGGVGWLVWRVAQERQVHRQSQELARQTENKQRELEQRLAQLEQSGGDQLKRERELRLAAEAERDQLQDQLASNQVARQDVPVYIARLTSERAGDSEVKLHLNTVAPTLSLRLLISKPYEFPEYAIELIDERGQLVRRISKVRPSGDAGALSVRLNRATLRAGKYRLRLFGRRGTTEQHLGDYVLLVTVGR